MNYLIDPQGHWWRWPSATLAERLGHADPDFDLAGYAVRNLGYVWLIVEEQVTLMQFRAGMVSPAAVSSLKPYLRKAVAAKPVALVFYASGWLEEAFIKAAPLLARLDELAPLAEPRMRDQFIALSHQPREWLYHAHQHLSSLFELWRFEGGVFSKPVQRYLDNSGLIERTVFITPRDNELYVTASGSGFTIYDSFQMNRVAGRRISDQPDRAYGSWVEASYRTCFDSGRPAMDDVDAIIEEPDHDPRRRRYQRMILPWQQADGSRMLTGSSLLNAQLAIPLSVDSSTPGSK
ncbi:MAG: hypothetical protein OJJ21_05635 [Ferrovibrio sp.]|uniref:hypothetical protein n=1 Tax=Ferrovibrio sp. TaxID=1917215 RepID=UPI0026072CCF|nr:hypothetical protein [Ferrovibrio sp.]MCW0233062.1 hypothetical protein [Ferrovibrio sp.]